MSIRDNKTFNIDKKGNTFYLTHKEKNFASMNYEDKIKLANMLYSISIDYPEIVISNYTKTISFKDPNHKSSKLHKDRLRIREKERLYIKYINDGK